MSEQTLLERFLEGSTNPDEDDVLYTNLEGFREALTRRMREIDIQMMDTSNQRDRIALTKKKAKAIDAISFIKKEIREQKLEADEKLPKTEQRKLPLHPVLVEIRDELRAIRCSMEAKT